MSQDNVEIVRRGYEALGEGDLRAVLHMLDPAAEIRSARDSPDGRLSIGHSGLLANFARLEESFEAPSYEAEEFFNAGTKVVVFVRMRARGRGSGVEVNEALAHVWTLRDGKGVALDIYLDRREALEAAGLSKQAVSQENIEVMAAAIEGLNARDTRAIDVLFDDEVEWRPALTAGGAVEGSVYRGKAGMAKYVEEVDSGFDEMRMEVARIDPVGPDRVLFRGRVIARGSASGIPLDVPIWGLWEIRGGKLFRGDAFLTEKEALNAAGLSEQAMSQENVEIGRRMLASFHAGDAAEPRGLLIEAIRDLGDQVMVVARQRRRQGERDRTRKQLCRRL